MERSFSAGLGLLAVALLLLTAPLMIKKCFMPAPPADAATATSTEEGSEDLSFDDEEEEGGLEASSFGECQARPRGVLAPSQVERYIEQRALIRSMRDEKIGRGESTANVEREAVESLGHDYEEYLDVKERISRVQRLASGTAEEKEIVARNYDVLSEQRDELRRVGVTLPTPSQISTYRFQMATRSLSNTNSNSPWGPQTPTLAEKVAERERERQERVEELRRRREEERYNRYKPRPHPIYSHPSTRNPGPQKKKQDQNQYQNQY
jgi:hypothetical protein